MVIPGFFKGTEMPTTGWWQALWPDPAGVSMKVGIGPGMEVIDLCSGDGWFTMQIAGLCRHVTAIDVDRQLLDAAAQRLAQNNLSNCKFVEGDAYDIAMLVQRPADFVFMANVFHGVPERTRLAQAVLTVLKPGGRFAIVNWNDTPREQTTLLGEPRGPATELRMTPQATIADVEPAGFKLNSIVELPPYHYGAIFEKP